MAKEATAMSVITLPLKLENWQIDCLNKTFRLCEQIYNNMLRYELKQYRKMQQDKRYIHSKEIIRNVYKMEDKDQKNIAKKSEEYKAAAEENRAIMLEYGMSEFSFIKDVKKFRNVYKENVMSAFMGRSIAKPMWAAFQKMEFGNGTKVHFKRNGDFKSITSDGKSAIILKADGKTTHCADTTKKLNLVISTKRSLTVPIDTSKLNLYEKEMLCRPFKTITIKRVMVNGSYRYYAAFATEGAPALKRNLDTGDVLHPVGSGKVGLYVDSTSLTIAKLDGTSEQFDLNWKCKYEDDIKELERYMDNSRRVNNPGNYNEDGTVKNGIMVDGRRRKLYWNNSNGYKKARAKKADLQRKDKEARQLHHQELANYIISLGG